MLTNLTDEEIELRSRLLEKLKPAFARNDKRKFKKRKSLCYKKQLSKKEAQTILNYIKRKDKRDERRRETRYYHCPICNTYHLTKQP